MNTLKQYTWEVALVAAIGATIGVMTLVTHLTARPEPLALSPSGSTPPVGLAALPGITTRAPKATRALAKPATPLDPHEVDIGPSAIKGRFILLATHVTPADSTAEKLTLRLRVVSHAVADLVTPFQSAMLELHLKDREPILPEHPFSHPVSAGSSREEDIAFVIPSGARVDHPTLRIHYYSEQKEIPLDVPATGR